MTAPGIGFVLFAALLLAGRASPAWGQAGEGQGEEAEAGGERAAVLAEALAEADDAWFFGDYAGVIEVLSPLLLPEPHPDLTPDQLVSAYELLGASLHFDQGPEQAEEAFVALLYLDPDHDLDPFVFPASMREFLERLRREHHTALEEIRRQRRVDPVAGQIFVGRTVERRSLLVSVLPFGIGHFVNGQPGWGAFYLVTEVLLGGVSAGMFAVNELSRGADGFYADAGPARTRRAIQLGTGIAFFAVLIGNVVHGAVIHQEVLETTYELLEEPPADFLGPRSRLDVYGGPTGLGWEVGVGWRF